MRANRGPSSNGNFRYEGAPAGIEKTLIRASWSPKGDKIGAGGADGSTCVWDVDSKKLLYKLPGHRGTVNDMRFSPMDTEPISKFLSPPPPPPLLGAQNKVLTCVRSRLRIFG